MRENNGEKGPVVRRPRSPLDGANYKQDKSTQARASKNIERPDSASVRPGVGRTPQIRNVRVKKNDSSRPGTTHPQSFRDPSGVSYPRLKSSQQSRKSAGAGKARPVAGRPVPNRATSRQSVEAPTFMAPPSKIYGGSRPEKTRPRRRDDNSPPSAVRVESPKRKTKSRNRTKKKFSPHLLVTLLLLLVLIPTLYLVAKALGVFPAVSAETEETEFTSNEESELTADPSVLDTSSEEYILAQRITAQDIIYPGVSLEGESYANLTRAEAKERLTKLGEDWSSTNCFLITLDDNKHNIKCNELGITLDTEALLDEMWSYGRRSTHDDPKMQILNRYQEIMNLEDNPVDLSVKYKYSEQEIEANLQNLFADSLPASVSAKATSFNEGKLSFNIQPEVIGKKADLTAAARNIVELLDNPTADKRIEIKTEDTYPEIMASDLSKRYICCLRLQPKLILNMKVG